MNPENGDVTHIYKAKPELLLKHLKKISLHSSRMIKATSSRQKKVIKIRKIFLVINT